jgi:hypothetical protein
VQEAFRIDFGARSIIQSLEIVIARPAFRSLRDIDRYV